jgi:phosphoribosylamine--glycine ligase
MNAVAEKKLSKDLVKWKTNHVGCLVLASGGYPGSYEKGKIITGLDKVNDDIVIFHAGTSLKEGNIVTNGGRVLNICAEGKDLQSVRSKLYKAAEVINFDGKYYRKDIGLI